MREIFNMCNMQNNNNISKYVFAWNIRSLITIVLVKTLKHIWNTTKWYFHDVSYLMQLHFAIVHHDFKDFFFDVFWNNRTRLDDQSVQHHLCLYDRVSNQHNTDKWLFSTKQSLDKTPQAIAELERYFFPLQSNVFSIVLKITKVASFKPL